MPVEVNPSEELNSPAMLSSTIVAGMTHYHRSLSGNRALDSRRTSPHVTDDSAPDQDSTPPRILNLGFGIGRRYSRMGKNFARAALEQSGTPFHDLNVKRGNKFPVFFAGGSVIVRAWATGAETVNSVKYLSLMAFGAFDSVSEENLIVSHLDPQLIEWPSTESFSARVGANTSLQEKPLYRGCIIEIRSPQWLEEIRHGRERVLYEAKLAPMTQWQRQTLWLHLLLNEPTSSRAASVYAYAMFAVIVVSTLTFCLETLPWYYEHNSNMNVWFFIEATCIAIFTVELALRFLVVPNKRQFFTSWLNIIDFVAIAPFFLEMSLQGAEIPGLSVLRVTRLTRVLRLLKHSQGHLKVLTRTLSESIKPMGSLIMLLGIAAILFGAVAYYAERGDFNRITGDWYRRVGLRCPVMCSSASPGDAIDVVPRCEEIEGDVATVDFRAVRVSLPWDPASLAPNQTCVPILERSPFDSIPISIWWSVVTMTTLGYGDMVPISSAGKFIGFLCMLCGTLVIALPVTVIGQNFSTIYAHVQQMQKHEADARRRRRELAKQIEVANEQLNEYEAMTFRVISSNKRLSTVPEAGSHNGREASTSSGAQKDALSQSP